MLLYRKIDKATETATVIGFPVGSRFHQPASECSITLSHNGLFVLIATNMTNDNGSDPPVPPPAVEESALVLKVRISDDALMWARRVPLDPDHITGIEIERSERAGGAASGYTVVGTVTQASAGDSVLFAFKVFSNGSAGWMYRKLLQGNTTLTDADIHRNVLRWAGWVSGDIVVQGINTVTGNMTLPTSYARNGEGLYRPKIAMRTEGQALDGFYLTFERIQTTHEEPIALRARNDGSIVWSRTLEDTDIPVGLISSGSTLYTLARAYEPTPGSSIPYRRFALDAGTGDIIPARGIGVQLPWVLPALSFSPGYMSRPLISANDFAPRPHDEWAVYKEHVSLIPGLANHYDCSVDFAFETRPLPVTVGSKGVGPSWYLSMVEHSLESFEPVTVKVDCGG
ncbi:MAG: hypothetical protein GY711_13030 [bacterium]|nr:hypothetical protein [bacterium]